MTLLNPTLPDLLHSHFPDAVFDAADPHVSIGAFPAWDSLAHFNFLMLVEETYGVRFSMEEMAELKSLSAIATIILQHKGA